MKPARSLAHGSLAALLAAGLWASAATPATGPATDPKSGPSGGDPRGGGTPAKTPSVPFSGRSEDEVLLVELRLRYQTLSQSFPVFPVKDGSLIPLGALCHELDLGVKVDPMSARAEGFVISESRKFLLDVRTQHVELSGKTLPYVPSQVEVHPDDIYVDTRLVAQWLPLDLQVDRLKALMVVTPREPLPIELAQDRFRSFSVASRRQGDRRSYLNLEDPYKWAEMPMIDETLRFVYAGSSDPKFQAQSSTFAAGDFLKMTGKAYVSVGSPGQSIFRGSLGRTNPDPVLLGPLHARQFSFGDMQDPGLAMVSLPTAGSGVFVTNYPENQWVQSQRRSFRGDLPQGWQVELYQNGALVGLQASQADGTYEFRDVPLQFGWNDFRLEFYGPQGQRRDENLHINAEQPLAPEGEYRYAMSAERPYDLQGGRAELLGAYGFTKKTSAFAALSTVDLPGSSQRFGVAGVQTNWEYFTTRFTGTVQQGGGSAGEISLSTRIGGVSIQAARDQLAGNFYSEVFIPTPDFIRSRTSVDFSGSLPSLDKPWVNLGLNAKRDEFVNGGVQDQLMPRIGFSLAGWFVSDTAVIQHNAFAGGASSTTAYGDLLVSRQLGPENLRGEAIYSFKGSQGRTLQSVAAYVSTLRFQPWTMQLGYLHSTQGGGDTVLGTAAKNFGRIGISIDTSWSRQSHLTAALTLRMNLAREPRTGSWQALAQASALQGAASGFTFVDSNNNGRQDPGEAPVAGAGFLLNGMANGERTGANGVAFLRNLPTDQYVKMAVSQQTFEDPFMQGPAKGWRFLPRPGHTTLLGTPVVMTGDINGTIYTTTPEGGKSILAGVGLDLLDASGHVAAQTRSGYDGYYDLGSILPGDYTLRLRGEDLEHLGLADPGGRPVKLEPTGTELDGVDFKLKPKSAAPAQPASAKPAAAPAPEAAVPFQRPQAAKAPIAGEAASTPAPASTSAPLSAPAPTLAAPRVEKAPASRTEAALSFRPTPPPAAAADTTATLTEGWRKVKPMGTWAVRFQVVALDSSIRHAAAYLAGHEARFFAQPWPLPNSQCCPQLFIGGFRTRSEAQRFMHRLHLPPESRKELDPPRLVRIADLLKTNCDCTFYAPEPAK